MKYEFLKPFLNPGENKDGKLRNWFYSVSLQEIEESEKRLNLRFPSQLREFYQEIGYGSLEVPHSPEPDYDSYGSNMIYTPSMLADTVLLGPDSGYIIDASYELLEPGDLPFFEIGDSTRFLIMKAHSDNPNAVWSGAIKIEDSFERFIWRLYYESPWFYDDIIENYYKTNPTGLAQTLEARKYKACPDNLSLAEELIYYMSNQELDKARARLVKILNDPRSFTKLKEEIHNIPLTMLHGLIELMLSKSQYHKAECEELLNLRMRNFQIMNNDARGNSRDPSSR